MFTKSNAFYFVCKIYIFQYFSSFSLPDPGYQILASDPGYQILATRSRRPDPGYQILATKCLPPDLWLPDPGNNVSLPILINSNVWGLALGSSIHILGPWSSRFFGRTAPGGVWILVPPLPDPGFWYQFSTKNLVSMSKIIISKQSINLLWKIQFSHEKVTFLEANN